MKRLRILQLHTRYRQPGGEYSVVRAEARLLRRAGHIVLRHEFANARSNLGAIGSLATAPWNPWAHRIVRDLANRFRPDVAHVHNTWFAMSPAIFSALRGAGVPVIATLHNYRSICANGMLFRDEQPCEDCVGSHPWHGVRHRCYRNSVGASAAVATTITLHRFRGTWDRDVDKYIVPTQFARQRHIAGGLPANRIHVKPNFTVDPGPRLCAPRESDFVLYVGRLSTEKGIDELMRAWIAAGPARLHLRIVGDGPLRERLADSRAPRVEVMGPRPREEVERMMLSARALVFPSRWYETFGLVVVEAMAAGLPVLATDLGGIRELLGDDEPRALIPPGPDTWVNALQALEDDSWLDEAGRRGRGRYVERFTPEVNLEALEDIYRTASVDLAR